MTYEDVTLRHSSGKNLTRLFCGELMRWLCQYFYNVPGEVFVYFIMPWHWLFLACFRIYVKVVSLAMSQENTSKGSDLLDKVFSLYTERVSSLTLCCSGTSSIVISM
jgi:hypothetical protein